MLCRFSNSQFHRLRLFKAGGFTRATSHSRVSRECRRLVLLFDESIVCPEALGIAIAGIHEFDIMADHANDSETRVFRRGDALISGEEFLHFLLFAGLRMMVGGVELILRQTAIRIG